MTMHIHRTPTRLSAVTAVLVTLAGGAIGTAIAGDQPNVLFIISDDAGWADFGFNDQGNGQIPTPALDSIAARGRWFRAAYTAPVCSPSRARMFLGQHGQRRGYDNNGPDDQNAANSVVEGLTLEDETIFERMNDAGYHVGFFGKWHQGTERDVVNGNTLITPGNLPPRHGIDEFLGLTGGSRTYFIGQTNQYTQLMRRLTLDPVTNIVSDINVENTYPANAYMTEILAEEAADYITDRAAQPDPFFAILSFTAPHGPLQATQQYFDFVDQNIPGLTGNRRTYAAMMVAMDMGVQTVLDRLDDPNQDGDIADSITNNTIVCFINDNGGETANSARNFPLRGKKSDTFDGGIRVMMTMAGPGIPATGQSFDFPVDSSDLMPTFLAAAGTPLGPDDFTDGVDLLPYLDGTLTGPPHEDVYVRGNNPIVAGLRRSDEWKLTIENIGGPFLYDIESNPGESTVRNNDFPGLVDELTDRMTAYEVEYTKPRWGPTDYNTFDGFIWRASAVGSAGWGASNAWAAEGGNPAAATMFERDGYANLRMTFPGSGTPYTATNTLSRPNALTFIANEIVFNGSDSGVALDGLPVMLADSLAGQFPVIRMDTVAPGMTGDPIEIGLDISAWDDVLLFGDSEQPMLLSGAFREERPGRNYTKFGSFPMTITGGVEISGEFSVQAGDVTVRDTGLVAPSVLMVAPTARLHLTEPDSAGLPDLIGNQTELALTSPEGEGGPPPVALDFEGGEVIGSLTIDGTPVPGDYFDASAFPTRFSGPGRLRIRGPLVCDGDVNNDGYAEFFDTLAYLRVFDANDGCGGGGPALPGGITVNTEAWNDPAGDGTWDLASPGTDLSRVWTFGGNLTPEAVADGPSPLIASAYRFPEAAATAADYETPSRSPSSIELWFNADNTSTEQVLWEAGGGARGAAFTIANGLIRFDVQNSSPAPVRVSAPITTGWHQVVGTININTGQLALYLDSLPVGTVNTGATDRWAGGNPSGLGQVTSSMVGNLSPAPFAGRIAVYRFYNNTVLTPAEVEQAYDAVIDASEPCDPAADLNRDGVVDAADIERHIIQLIGCE